LNFLPAFEAAGRLGSFKAAAAELHVTASAVSQQIKVLEDMLGRALFERRGRAVVLTRAGTGYLSEIQRALAAIGDASRRIRRSEQPRALRLTTADFIAYDFLLPRLSSFRTRFPELELSLETTTRVIDFSSSEIDAAIRISKQAWPGLQSHVLGEASIAPVCSQELATTIKTLADLSQHTLIEVRGQEHRGWKPLLRRHGIHKPLRTLSCDGYLEALRATEQGQGVTFGVFPLTTEWVVNRRLAVPLALRIPMAAKTCFVHRTADVNCELYEALVAWLREQYLQLQPLPPGRIVRRSARAR
jgi:LysR family glycine cleavage system transcriptional activator